MKGLWKRLTASLSDAEDDQTPIEPITLEEIPTLRYLYKSKRLIQSPNQARFPFRDDFLDRVSLFQGDITRLAVDSIVNAANRSLLGGGGVDGAIHSAAGYGLLKECRTLGGADTGEAKITKGYNLPSKHIIHAVGPVYSNSQRDIKAAQLSSCYSNSLVLAIENSLTSIAFCSISTGIYGYPIEDATHIALETTRTFLEQKGEAEKLERVIFVVWSNKDKEVYEELIPQYFPETDMEAQEGQDDGEEQPPETQESQMRDEEESMVSEEEATSPDKQSTVTPATDPPPKEAAPEATPVEGNLAETTTKKTE
ncbi:hypothetical protein FRC14_002459 [Serendipita sp. 396]|nr:hypothetical protein FRC14_002459 [Serendipita sp. 396]